MNHILALSILTVCCFAMACSKEETKQPAATPAFFNDTATTEKKAAEPAPSPKPTQTPKPEPTKAGSATGLEGQWTLDLEGFKATEEFKALDPKMKEMGLRMFQAMKMKLTIGPDSIRTEGELMGRKQDKTTKYTVTKKEGNTYTLDVSYGDDKPNKSQVMEVDGDRLIIRDGKLMVVLKRI